MKMRQYVQQKRVRLLLCSVILLLLLAALLFADIGIRENGFGFRDDFVMRSIKLPHALAALFCGFAFGVSGSLFQSLLGNPLASPDMIGISDGTSVCAVFSILILKISGPAAAVLAFFGGLLVTFLIYGLSTVNGFTRAKMILIGIGIQVFLKALLSWLLLIASEYQLQTAMRWISGSLNGVQLEQLPAAAAVAVLLLTVILWRGRTFCMLELGDELAAGLGVHLRRTRVLFIACALAGVAVSTSIVGPMGAVAFLSGPIARRLSPFGKHIYLHAGMIGALLLLCADMLGQYAFPVRYPAGILTSIIGVPYLLYVLVRLNKE